MAKNEEGGFFDHKLELVKRYGLIGLVGVTFPIWQPYLDEYLDDRNTDAVYAAVHKSHAPIRQDIVELESRLNSLRNTVFNMETLMIDCKGGIKILDADEVIRIVNNAATLKAQRIRDDLIDLLYNYKRETPSEIARFRSKVKESMQRSRVIFLSDIKDIQQRGVGVLADYLDSNFPKEEYLDLIMQSIVSSSGSEITHYRIATDAYLYMKDMQAEFFKKMYKKMREAEVKNVKQ